MFISTRSENVVYVCALQFPLGEAVQQNSCISLHVLLLLLNIYISGFSSLPGFPLLMFGFLVEACSSVVWIYSGLHCFLQERASERDQPSTEGLTVHAQRHAV